MIERQVKDISSKEDEHYSSKGGHLLRGEYWEVQKFLETRMPYLCARAAVPQNTESSWLIRRDMLRVTNDGKR